MWCTSTDQVKYNAGYYMSMQFDRDAAVRSVPVVWSAAWSIPLPLLLPLTIGAGAGGSAGGGESLEATKALI